MTAEKAQMDIDIRPASHRDVSGISALENACFGPKAWDRHSLGMCVRDSIQSPTDTTLLVAFNKAANGPQAPLVAYILATLDHKAGEITSLAVDEKCRGQALGTTLLNRACDQFRQAGASHIVLQVQADNAVAIHLYEKSGFAKTRNLPGYYPEDAIEMTRFFKRHRSQTPRNP